jgi:UDP-N-acetyl-D-glucosamine dehydrogenase
MAGARVLVTGVAYKPDIDDMRESPALKVIDLLVKEGAQVAYYDPYIPVLPKTRKYDFKLESVSLEQITDGYFDAAVIVTNHSNIDYREVLKKAGVVIDTRNALKQEGVKSEKIQKA